MKRIVHLGLGAFHRAHQAAYLQDLIDAGERDWELVAGDIRPGNEALLDALRAQACAYTLELVDPEGQRQVRRIHAIRAVLDLPDLIAAAAEPSTAIVSFTVTEAGYAPDAAIYAVLADVLTQRRANAAGPLTLLCCDNLRHNGPRTRAGLLNYLEAQGDTELRDWAAQNTRSPATMVDRITPRPDAALRERTGDAVAVMCESFTQWVIEDDFAGPRPAWERVGVQLVRDVVPFEEAKIRLLNASHSILAWSGALRGHEFIDQCARDPACVALAHAWSEDAMACLADSPLDLPAYRDSVLARFRNVALGDTVARVSQDSGAKVLGFFLPTLSERLAQGASAQGAAQALGLYARWVLEAN